MTDLKNRGVQDLFVACVDWNFPGRGSAPEDSGLTGFPEAIAATYPQALVQLCMVHLVRNSVAFVSYKDRKAVCCDLRTNPVGGFSAIGDWEEKAIYSAATEAEAQMALELFADSPFSSGGKPSYRNGLERWDGQYPTISKSWKQHWGNVIPMFVFPPEIRKVMYTTSAIESVNMCLRKVTKSHRIFQE